jgi:hypothetical protein
MSRRYRIVLDVESVPEDLNRLSLVGDAHWGPIVSDRVLSGLALELSKQGTRVVASSITETTPVAGAADDARPTAWDRLDTLDREPKTSPATLVQEVLTPIEKTAQLRALAAEFSNPIRIQCRSCGMDVLFNPRGSNGVFLCPHCLNDVTLSGRESFPEPMLNIRRLDPAFMSLQERNFHQRNEPVDPATENPPALTPEQRAHRIFNL